MYISIQELSGYIEADLSEGGHQVATFRVALGMVNNIDMTLIYQYVTAAVLDAAHTEIQSRIRAIANEEEVPF